MVRLRLIKHGSSHSEAHVHQRQQARRWAARHEISITGQDLLPFLIILFFPILVLRKDVRTFVKNINSLFEKIILIFSRTLLYNF
jgi:hypothetical protein